MHSAVVVLPRFMSAIPRMVCGKERKNQLTDTGFTVEKDNLTSTLVGHEVRGPWGLLILSRTVFRIQVLQFVRVIAR